MFDQFAAAARSAGTPGERLRATARLENAACAARLSAMADLLETAYAADGSADREQWRCDNWSSVCAQIGVAQTLTAGMVNSLLIHAVCLRERLPMVAAVFADGLITYLLVRTICQRTSLVKDATALRAIDAELAGELRLWGAKSLSQTERDIDALVLRHDPYAVRRTELVARTTKVDVYTDDATGVSHVDATVNSTDGAAFDRRADLLAHTVCRHDPRTIDQRRGAALGAMGFGWDRLPCMCERPDCDAATRPPVGGVVIHLIARTDTLDHPRDTPPLLPDPDIEPPPDAAPPPDLESDIEPAPPIPGVGDLTAQRRALVGDAPPLLKNPLRGYTLTELTAELDADPGQFCPATPGIVLGGTVLPAPVIAQTAAYATFTPLRHPGQNPPEPHYRPSRALADFVRARDQTCRHPGCARPATVCEIDHVVPYPWGPTCASNLACLCTEHHLLKTFWLGWSYQLDIDGTATWTDPEGRTSTSHPGCRLLFPELCRPTATFEIRGTPPPKHPAGLRMPRRAATRKEARARRVDDERRRNTES